MATSETINESMLGFFQRVYHRASVRNADHLVLVANFGQWAGFWSADRFITDMGYAVPASNHSSMNTLTEALLDGDVSRPKGAEDLLDLVDGFAEAIFGDTSPEWSTLRRLISTDGVVKRATAATDPFDVQTFAHDVLAVRQGFITEGRDYFGNQTDEMCAAIAEAGYGDLLSTKGTERSVEAYGEKADGSIDPEPTDPDKGIWTALETINRVMTGDRKCHKEAYFVQEMAKTVDNFENFRISLGSAELVETTVEG
jgi:hypothetical protein